MAVGYQYQSDYDKKETKKGFKKKFIILGIGLTLLVVIAIIGAPKKASVDSGLGDYSGNTYNLEANTSTLSSDELYNKTKSDNFLKSLSDKSIDRSNLVNLDQRVTDNYIRNSLPIKKSECFFVNVSYPFSFNKNIYVYHYSCSDEAKSKTYFISIALHKKLNNKIFNWSYSEKGDDDAIIKSINGGK